MGLVLHSIIAIIVLPIVNSFFIFVLLPFFGGFNPNYSVGIAKSIYISDHSYNSFYKSYEVIGFVGEDSKNFQYVRMSTRDENVAQLLKDNLNKRVDVEYRKWLLKPHFYSESDNILTKVEPSL